MSAIWRAPANWLGLCHFRAAFTSARSVLLGCTCFHWSVRGRQKIGHCWAIVVPQAEVHIHQGRPVAQPRKGMGDHGARGQRDISLRAQSRPAQKFS